MSVGVYCTIAGCCNNSLDCKSVNAFPEESFSNVLIQKLLTAEVHDRVPESENEY